MKSKEALVLNRPTELFADRKGFSSSGFRTSDTCLRHFRSIGKKFSASDFPSSRIRIVIPVS